MSKTKIYYGISNNLLNLLLNNTWDPRGLRVTINKQVPGGFFLRNLPYFGNNETVVDYNQLTILFNRNMKVSYHLFYKCVGFMVSIGSILSVFKLIEKREKKLDKNKLLFMNYVLKSKISVFRLWRLSLIGYKVSTLSIIRKSMVFKKVKIDNLNLIIPFNSMYAKKVRRIKRRLKKRIFRYELLKN